MKFFKNKLTVTIIVLSVAFLIIIGYSADRNEKSVVENGIGVSLNSVQGVMYNIGDKIKNSFYYITNFSQVKNENKKLKNENSKLKSELTEYKMLKDENKRLKDMLDFKKENEEFKYIGCKILGKSGGNYDEGLIIDKGSKDGIQKKMTVLNSEGFIGQITSVGENWSIIQTLESENIALGGYVVGSKDNNGIVKGYKDKENRLLAKLYYLPMDSTIKEGDEVLTGLVNSNLKDVEPGIYPKGIRIGKIIKIQEDKGQMMKNAIIEPYVELNKLEEIFVAVPKGGVREIKY